MVSGKVSVYCRVEGTWGTEDWGVGRGSGSQSTRA